jgi:NitT/TauT family transport system ATP-binding protein
MASSARRASGVVPSDADVTTPDARVPSLLGPSFDSVTPVRSPAPAVEPAVRIEHVGKRFGDGPLVLDDITLDIAPGEFVCLLGASGCGKSTLLNLIADSTARPRVTSRRHQPVPP